MIPQSFTQELLHRVDIVDVIERHLPLKKSGANFSACCPFHSEKSPSFTVSPSKQFYHCFGCGAHGSAIGFIMEYNGLGFVEAVKELAAQVGLQVPEHQRSEGRGPGSENQETEYRSQDLFEVMKVATQFYRQQLKQSDTAIAYLKKRGLSGETAARFGIGYAPAGWQNLSAAFPNYDDPKLVESGLVKTGGDDEVDGKNGDKNQAKAKRYDRFRDRIMFPILNQKGMVVGFGGRVLDQCEPKYLNSPETPLFEKGRELYNLFAARKAIREAGRALVVEGYMDVVALSQHGIDYAVAALGTATTPHHIQKLLRQTDDIVFCFDGDNAGRKAAWRALENALAQLSDGKKLSFLFLPEGEDPDSFVRQSGKAAFEALFKQALPLSAFLFKELSASLDLQTSEGRAKLVQDARPLLGQVEAPALSLMLLKRLAELSGTSQQELDALLQIKRGKTANKPRERAPRTQPASPHRWLMQVLLHDVRYVHKLKRECIAGPSDEAAALRALVEFIDAHPRLAESTSMIVPAVNAYFAASPHRAHFEKAASETFSWDEGIDLDAEFSGALSRLEEMRYKERMTLLRNKSLGELTQEERRELQNGRSFERAI